MVMPWIENIGLKEVKDGFHHDPGPNSMLIQIVDLDTEFPKSKYEFRETRKFKFLDVEDDDELLYDGAISDDDAYHIARALRHAFENSMNVVVHCHMGVSRSGAVAEVGTMIGFRDAGKFRVPNRTVKRKLMKELNLLQY